MAQQDRLSQYIVEQCTCKGQLSEVYQAVHKETNTAVAIKKLMLSDMNATMQRECETEIGLLQALDHPHLIKYYEHFANEGELLVVMELAAGGTLAQRAAEVRRTGTRLEERFLWRWLCDISSALAYLHRQRVLHRDVKPSHIFLGEGEQAKLGDFGLSKPMSTQTNFAFSCVGTPFYMSPELVKGEGYSFSSDVWSLGCSLYEAAEGYPPFYRSDMNFKALGDAICSANYPPLPDQAWSGEFSGVIRRILTVDPSSRPDAQDVLDAAGRRLVARIQDFEIVGTIGRGRFSEVHRSIWRAGNDREVALKRIQFFDMDSELRRQCRAEVNMLKNMDHHRIIKYLDSFLEDSELVIVLELAPHGDLSGLCRRRKQENRPLAEEQVLSIFLQVCDALCYMHRNRIMHRDIKPANIFICNHGHVKLGDLGLGRYFSSNTDRAHSVVGTPFYMSPEVIGNSEGYGFKSDIWSLGCVLYELEALDNPFSSSRLNYYMLGKHICNAEYPALPGSTSDSIRRLVGQMIQVDRDARPDAASVFAEVRRHFSQCARMQEDSSSQRLLKRAAEVVKGVVEPSRASPPPGRAAAGGMVASPVQGVAEDFASVERLQLPSPSENVQVPVTPVVEQKPHPLSASMTVGRSAAAKQALQVAGLNVALGSPSAAQPASPAPGQVSPWPCAQSTGVGSSRTSGVTPPPQAPFAGVTPPAHAPPHGVPPLYAASGLAVSSSARARGGPGGLRGPADGSLSARGVSQDSRAMAGGARDALRKESGSYGGSVARRARTPPSRVQDGVRLLPPIQRPQARAAYPMSARDPVARAGGASAAGPVSARGPGSSSQPGSAGSYEGGACRSFEGAAYKHCQSLPTADHLRDPLLAASGSMVLYSGAGAVGPTFAASEAMAPHHGVPRERS